MGFLGGITISIKTDDLKVIEASVKPDKEVKAEQLLIGKEPVQALSLIGNLFALCPRSQRVAASAAFNMAINGEASQEFSDSLARSVQAERIAEGFRFFVLQLPEAQWRAKHTSTIVRIFKLAQELENKTDSETDYQTLKTALANQLVPFLEEAFEGSWENDILNGIIKDADGGIANVFKKLSTHRSAGWTTVPVLKATNKVFLENLKSTGTSLEKFSAGPFAHVTGACARMRRQPLTFALLKSDGDSAYTRFAARFEELLQDLQNAPVADELVYSLLLADASAISIVQNSRGVLLHSVKLEKNDSGDPIIADYCILTPTEINVTKAPSFTKSLEGIKGSSEKELEELVNLVALSYDPCTEIKLEVSHA